MFYRNRYTYVYIQKNTYKYNSTSPCSHMSNMRSNVNILFTQCPFSSPTQTGKFVLTR